MSATSQSQQRFSTALNQNPFARNLGFVVTEVQRNKVILEMPITAEQHANPMGIVHGGVLMSIADTAMGCACVTLGSLPTTMDMNINFMKSVKTKGTIRAVASVLHHGRHTMVAEAEVFDEDGELVAKARGTFFIVGKVSPEEQREMFRGEQ